jgi:hypothetical protein
MSLHVHRAEAIPCWKTTASNENHRIPFNLWARAVPLYILPGSIADRVAVKHSRTYAWGNSLTRNFVTTIQLQNVQTSIAR